MSGDVYRAVMERLMNEPDLSFRLVCAEDASPSSVTAKPYGPSQKAVQCAVRPRDSYDDVGVAAAAQRSRQGAGGVLGR